MNKNRSIRVAAFCLGLMLAGSLQVHAQKVTFRDGTVSLKQAFEKIEASDWVHSSGMSLVYDTSARTEIMIHT